MFDLKYRFVVSDQIRKEIFGSLRDAHDNITQEERVERNGEVFNIFYKGIEDGLRHSIDTVADATNLSGYSRDHLREIAERTGARTHLVLFKNIEEARARNASRDYDMIVPEEVMENFIKKFQTQTLPSLIQEHYDSVTEIASLR